MKTRNRPSKTRIRFEPKFNYDGIIVFIELRSYGFKPLFYFGILNFIQIENHRDE